MNIIHATNPFNPTERDLYFSPDDLTIEEFLEKNNLEFNRPTVCVVNNQDGLLRSEYKNRKVSEFETITFVTLMEGGGDGSNPLAIVAMVALAVYAPAAAGWMAGATSGAAYSAAYAGIMIGGMALINALIPPPKIPSPHQTSIEQASSVYNLSNQGNVARLNSAIPEIFGTHRVYPDIASTPYTEYSGNDQYLYQLFCIGVGEFTVNDIKIEDTLISSFEEVTYEVVVPNTAVTLFPNNVETSAEVTGQEMTYNVNVGPFIVNSSNTDCNYISVDVVFPKGLYYANDGGGLDSRSINFVFEYAEVDDVGTIISAFSSLGSESISAATVTPIRKTYKYPVALGRYTVRARRTSTKDTSSRAGNDIHWEAARAYIPSDRVYGDVTMLAVRMRATNNLSQTSSRRINCSVSRKLESWSTAGGWSGTKVATSKPSWIMAYICSTYFSDDRFSLTDLEILETTLDARNTAYDGDDEFNGVFDNKMSMWEALQLVGKSVRTIPVIQGGVIHFIRDESQSLPTAMYSMRNIVKDSFNVNYILPSDDTSDAVEVEYFDADSLKPNTVLCELSPGSSTKIAKVKLFGVTNRDQAYREGMYHVASNRYRRILTSFDTELEGYIPTIGDLVAVSHDMPDWGQSGEILNYVEYATNYWRLYLSEEVVEGAGQHYIVMRDKDGSPTGPIDCTVDATNKDEVIVLKADVPITMNVTDDFEKTHYSFGISTEMYQLCRVIPPLKPKGNNLVTINVVNENSLVHTAETGVVPSITDIVSLPDPIVSPVISVLNVTVGGTASSPQLLLSWTPAAEADHYIIEWGTNNLEWIRVGETTSNNYIVNVIPDTIYVRVAGVGLIQGDWVSQSVDARLMIEPGPVQGLALAETFTGTQCHIKWSETARATSYKVEVYADAVLRRTATTSMLEYTYRSEDAVKDGGPWRSLTFKLYGVNDTGQSATSADLAVSNTAPSEMTGVNVYNGYESLIITYSAVADTDFAGVRVCMSETQGFTPGDGNAVYEGKDRIIVIPNLTAGTTQYLRLAAYDEFGKDSLTYTTIEYSGTPTDTVEALDPTDVLSKLNQELADATGDNLILEADRFAIKLDGSDVFPLIIANVDGTNYVGISADTVVEGTISADQITTGALATTTDIDVGDGAMIIDGDGSITVYDGDNTQSNRDFAFFSAGELSFQQYWNSSYHEYKAVKRVEHGSADSGTTVTIPGYWKTQPKVIVTPYELMSYDVTYTSQDQTWSVYADNLREDPASSGIYKFDAVAELILSSNVGTDVHNDSVTQSTNTWSSSTYQLPANTTSLVVNVESKSKRGVGSDGITWYYRKVDWRVQYHDTVLDVWHQSSWKTMTIGANIDNTVADSDTLSLPSNITEYYVEFSAADVGGTFTSGTQLYDYITHTTSQTNNQASWGAQPGSPLTFSVNASLAPYSPTAGYSIYRVDYIWTSYGYANGYNSSSTTDTVGTPFDLDSGGSVVTKTTPRTKTEYTSSYNQSKIWLSCTVHSGSWGITLTIKAQNAYAKIYTRKPVLNSSTADNTFTLKSATWTLSGTTALATGSLNYMAVEG